MSKINIVIHNYLNFKRSTSGGRRADKFEARESRTTRKNQQFEDCQHIQHSQEHSDEADKEISNPKLEDNFQEVERNFYAQAQKSV